jgi:hypothetical protein
MLPAIAILHPPFFILFATALYLAWTQTFVLLALKFAGETKVCVQATLYSYILRCVVIAWSLELEGKQ